MARRGDSDGEGRGNGGREGRRRNGNRCEVRGPGEERAIIGVLDLLDLGARKCLSNAYFLHCLSCPLRLYYPFRQRRMTKCAF